VAVNVSSVVVPMKGPTAAIGVVVAPFVITKAAGAVGNTLATANVVAADVPTPFEAVTLTLPATKLEP